MDQVARYNIERWQALVKAGALFTRPWLELDLASARERVDPKGLFGELGGKEVLCLASGGGQQSVAFTLLGARVTVADLSAAQLEQDEIAARHYGLTIKTLQADMRDLSALPEAAFDLVYHPYSLNFVPDVRQVFQQVARILRPNGLYHFMCANPFVCGLGTGDWDGKGYSLKLPYIDGVEIAYADESWVFQADTPEPKPIGGPREYRHTLSTLINGLAEQGFTLTHLEEWGELYPEAEPGSWDHFQAVAPPWLMFWTRLSRF